MIKNWQQTLGLLSWSGLPGVWQPLLYPPFFLLANGVKAGLEERSEGEREQVKGMEVVCTWRTKGAGESKIGYTVVGEEVEVGCTTQGPDRDKLVFSPYPEI